MKSFPLRLRFFVTVYISFVGLILYLAPGLNWGSSTHNSKLTTYNSSTRKPNVLRIKVDNHTSGLPKGHNYGANDGGGNTGKWRGAKGSFFEGGIRVPALISYPKQLPQAIIRHQAITAADWYPTVLDLCKILLPKVKLDGRTLLPIINSAHTPTHHILKLVQQEHMLKYECRN